jgi:DNA-binding beta-propeller fold protein YncE
MAYMRYCLVLLASLTACFSVSGCGSGGSSGTTGATGGNPPPTPAPQATLSASNLTFTGTDADYATTAQTVTLINTGTAALTISNIALGGTNPSDFEMQNPCPGSLAANAYCTITITFTPPSSGSFSAAINITDNASNSPQSVNLNGSLAATAAPAASAKFGYVANYDGTVAMFTISTAGVWTPTSPATINIGDYPGTMVIDPLGKFVFLDGYDSGDTFVYAINSSTGVLTAAFTYNATIYDESSQGLAIDPTGSFLYVVNTGTNTVSNFVVNRTTGVLSPGPTATISVGNQPVGIVVDPSGKFLYVSNDLSGTIDMFSINQSTGAPTPLTPATVTACEGFTPRFDPTGEYLFDPCSNGTGVGIFALNQTTGILTLVGNPNVPIPTGNGPTDSAVTIDGKFAYILNRSDGSISMYSFSSGALTQLAASPFTINPLTEPYKIALDPGGQLAYIADENVGVRVMKINSDGTLSEIAIVNTGGAPVAVSVFPIAP